MRIDRSYLRNIYCYYGELVMHTNILIPTG